MYHVYRSGVQFRGAYEWLLRMAKPKLYFKEHSLISELLKLCPILHQDYAPPLVSLNGSMHMILSVGMYTSFVYSAIMSVLPATLPLWFRTLQQLWQASSMSCC